MTGCIIFSSIAVAGIILLIILSHIKIGMYEDKKEEVVSIIGTIDIIIIVSTIVFAILWAPIFTIRYNTSYKLDDGSYVLIYKGCKSIEYTISDTLDINDKRVSIIDFYNIDPYTGIVETEVEKIPYIVEGANDVIKYREGD